jgi:hypothetical protein
MVHHARTMNVEMLIVNVNDDLAHRHSIAIRKRFAVKLN